jgi:two-component system response regulator HydG
MIGISASFTRAVRLAEQAAVSDATILLYGESGTGKELAARHVHQCSSRADGPFVPVHCAALPEGIIESELFGYEPGAFTGATRRRIGRLESADKGTLFLDEIGELPPSVQVKLLRVLQEGEIQRLGSNATVTVDVRIVAATHRDLAQLVRRGEFREDLFYRLNVIPVTLPPLRERPEDIEVLVHHFMSRSAVANARPVPSLTPRAHGTLLAWRWPGNIRELQNVIERAVVLDADGVIDVDDLPEALASSTGNGNAMQAVRFTVGTPLAEVERRMILATLEHTGGDKALAASILGVGRRTIYRKLDEFSESQSED